MNRIYLGYFVCPDFLQTTRNDSHYGQSLVLKERFAALTDAEKSAVIDNVNADDFTNLNLNKNSKNILQKIAEIASALMQGNRACNKALEQAFNS